MQNIFSTIWPHICVMCKFKSDIGTDLCSVCYRELPWLFDACYQCGEQLKLGQESIRCEQCMFLPPKFDRFCGIFRYHPPVIKFIRQLKFSHNLAYANLLGQLLLQQVTLWYKGKDLPQAIIPVPLHPLRLRNRGFNQVLEILLPLHNLGIIPIINDICVRTKNTKSQTKGGVTHRQRNLRGAFKLTRKIPHHHVVIMDDVFTTGSTIRAIAERLRDYGVEYIDVWCICRA